MCAERRPEGCSHDGKPTARPALGLTFDTVSLQQQHVDAGFSGFSGCLFRVPDRLSSVMVFPTVKRLRGTTSGPL